MTKKKTASIGKPMVKPETETEIKSSEEESFTKPKLLEEDAKDVGLFCAIEGPIVYDGCDYLHPLDLARIELCRVKRELSSVYNTLNSKNEREAFLLLQIKKQELRIAQLEYDARMKQYGERKDELKKETDIARQDHKNLAREIGKAYNIDANDLTYDDLSGKLQSID